MFCNFVCHLNHLPNLKLFIHIALLAIVLQAFAPAVQFFSTEHTHLCILDCIDEDGKDETEKSEQEKPENEPLLQRLSQNTPVFDLDLRALTALPFNSYALRYSSGHSGIPELPPEV